MGIMDYSLLLGIDTHTFHTGVPFDEPVRRHNNKPTHPDRMHAWRAVMEYHSAMIYTSRV